MAHQTKDPSNPERWVVVYPAYIDAEKTQAEGRKIAKAKAVGHPNIKEIIKAISDGAFPLQAKVENKAYCRDYLNRGRLRVQLKNSDGTLIHPDFPNRKALYAYLADKIKHSEDRKKEKEKKEKEAKAQAKKAQQHNSHERGGRRKGGRKRR